jgi:hypothetical protein
LGGLFMAAGHLLMTVQSSAVLLRGARVPHHRERLLQTEHLDDRGLAVPRGSGQRDAGFTIFYIGINLGAAMAPLLCGYIGETYGWHYGFGLATLGMLIGLAVFVVPTTVARLLILSGAIATSIAMVALQESALLLVVNGFRGTGARRVRHHRVHRTRPSRTPARGGGRTEPGSCSASRSPASRSSGRSTVRRRSRCPSWRRSCGRAASSR